MSILSSNEKSAGISGAPTSPLCEIYPKTRPESRKKYSFKEFMSVSPGFHDVFSPFRFRPESGRQTPQIVPCAISARTPRPDLHLHRHPGPEPGSRPRTGIGGRLVRDTDPGAAGTVLSRLPWTPDQVRGDSGGGDGFTLPPRAVVAPGKVDDIAPAKPMPARRRHRHRVGKSRPGRHSRPADAERECRPLPTRPAGRHCRRQMPVDKCRPRTRAAPRGRHVAAARPETKRGAETAGAPTSPL